MTDYFAGGDVSGIVICDHGVVIGSDVTIDDREDVVTVRCGTLWIQAYPYSTFQRDEGREACPQIPVWRRLALMPRGVQLPAAEMGYMETSECFRRIMLGHPDLAQVDAYLNGWYTQA